MVHRKILLLILICVAISAYSEELRISDFRLPSYKVYGLDFSGDVYKGYYADYIDYDLDFSPYFRISNDTTEFSFSSSIRGGHGWSSNIFSTSFLFDARHFLFSTPLFLHGKLYFHSNSWRDSERPQANWENYIQANSDIGVGLGHLREGQYVALALHINDILKKEGIIDENLCKETILTIAKIISKKRFFWLKYDRYEKYLFQEIEEALMKDSVYNKSIPVYTWFKIVEIAKAASYGGWSPYEYWQRMFGARFSIDFLAINICNYDSDKRIEFPFYDSYYYTPSIRFKYEYEKPVDLRKQISLNSAYSIEWWDTVSVHKVGINVGYGYGIIDFILLEGDLSMNYTYSVPQDTSPHGILTVSPEVEFSYYIEDLITINFEISYDFIIEKSVLPDRNYDFNSNLYFTIGTNWRIF